MSLQPVKNSKDSELLAFLFLEAVHFNLLFFDLNSVFCYVTDTEHKAGELDGNIIELARDADYLIYDSNYTEEEYEQHKGWGHSTWNAGADIADAAGVKTLIVFHHDPGHDDAFMDTIAEAADARRPGTIVAREGLTLAL